MFRACCLALIACLLTISSGLVGQDKKEDTKQDKKSNVKKDGTPTRLKGTLPPNWRKLGLTDAQVQEVYKVQAKYKEEIAKHEAEIRKLKAAMDKEEKAVLTPEQQKRLDEILTGKGK
jgi:peptidoglycan hydrolase CwlO-like protein